MVDFNATLRVGQTRSSQTAMRNFITTGVLYASLLLVSQSQAATDLSSLSVEARNSISRLCSPVQYREGAAAYRRCVKSEIESVQRGGNSELSALSFDDKYAVQQFCASAGDSHQSCINSQVASVRNITVPSMRNITDDEQYAIQQSCFSAQSTQGLLAYRQCVANEVASLKQLPRIDLNAMSVLQRNALQLRCSANSQTAAAYRQCLAVELTSFSNAAPTYKTTPAAAIKQAAAPANPITTITQVAAPQTTATATTPTEKATQASNKLVVSTNVLPVNNTLPRSIDPQRATDTLNVAPEPASVSTAATTASDDVLTPVSTPRVITKPELVEQIDIDARENATPDVAPGAGLVKLFGDATDSIKSKFNSLTALGKAVAGVVLAIPLLLLTLRAVMRRKRQQLSKDWDGDYQAQPVPDTINRSTEAIKARWDDDFLNDDITLPTKPFVSHTETIADITEDTTATRIVQRSNQHTAAAHAETRWQSGFGKWLETETISDRRQHCTEFLIYWMAYGDERYEKGLKERIFTEQNPNQHDQIKRWVLKQDVFAFADTINWLKRNTSKIQQEQILDLLMALLIAENNITPNQNVILRMLADAFGIGATTLHERFQYSYAQDLPAFPRTDKQSWWLEQSSETATRWDARKLAKLPDHEQMLSRLGLNQDYSESDVVKAFRRAAKRCHPDRFSHLGKWEQLLAQRQFERFEEARDKLLGVSV